MAGILDPKTRILDTVITQEGKRQIANGGLRAVYATVSDKSSYYEYSQASGSEDASRRIYFESPIENINDSIVMESDDSGKLLGYPVQGAEFYNTDGVITGRSSVSGSLVYAATGSISGFNSLANTIISSSIDRFKNLYTVGTRDGLESDNLQMKISPDSYSFTINNKFPFIEGAQEATTNVDYIEPLFFDELLANVINFQYLPPLKEPLTGREKNNNTSPPRNKRLGSYTKFHRPTKLTLQKIMNHMNVFSGSNAISGDPDEVYDRYSSNKQSQYYGGGQDGLRASKEDGSSVNLTSDQLPRERVSVFFDKTSSTNNLMMQMFEIDPSSSKLKKLDIIDFGTIFDKDDLIHPQKKIFFAGKIFINSINLPVFVNLFTIIMD